MSVDTTWKGSNKCLMMHAMYSFSQPSMLSINRNWPPYVNLQYDQTLLFDWQSHPRCNPSVPRIGLLIRIKHFLKKYGVRFSADSQQLIMLLTGLWILGHCMVQIGPHLTAHRVTQLSCTIFQWVTPSSSVACTGKCSVLLSSAWWWSLTMFLSCFSS